MSRSAGKTSIIELENKTLANRLGVNLAITFTTADCPTPADTFLLRR